MSLRPNTHNMEEARFHLLMVSATDGLAPRQGHQEGGTPSSKAAVRFVVAGKLSGGTAPEQKGNSARAEGARDQTQTPNHTAMIHPGTPRAHSKARCLLIQ